VRVRTNAYYTLTPPEHGFYGTDRTLPDRGIAGWHSCQSINHSWSCAMVKAALPCSRRTLAAPLNDELRAALSTTDYSLGVQDIAGLAHPGANQCCE